MRCFPLLTCINWHVDIGLLTAGFSLADALAPFELDYDEPADTYAEELAANGYTSRSALPSSSSLPKMTANTTTSGMDDDGTLFFPLDLEEDERNGFNWTEAQKADLEARSWNSGTTRRFKRIGTMCVLSPLYST